MKIQTILLRIVPTKIKLEIDFAVIPKVRSLVSFVLFLLFISIVGYKPDYMLQVQLALFLKKQVHFLGAELFCKSAFTNVRLSEESSF